MASGYQRVETVLKRMSCDIDRSRNVTRYEGRENLRNQSNEGASQ